MSAKDDYPSRVLYQGSATGTELRPPTRRPYSHSMLSADYDAAMAELDSLRTQVAELKAENAELEQSIANGDSFEAMIVAERDALRAALVKWKRAMDKPATWDETAPGYSEDEDYPIAVDELLDMIPDDLWAGAVGLQQELDRPLTETRKQCATSLTSTIC